MSKASTPGVDSGRSLISSSDNLIRSHSHDSNLQYSLNTTSSHLGTSGITSSRSIGDCLSVMNRTSVNPPSPIVSNTVRNQFGAVQKSPKTGRALHSIPHQWHRRKTFCITGETCHFCQRQLSFFGEYEKCKSCKWKVHSHCKAKIGDSCGLTPAHLKEALKEMFLKDSGDWAPTIHASTSQQHFPSDSIDSSSSTNSSAPSTPAFGVIHSATLPSTSSPYLLPSGSMVVRSNFDFPDTVPELPDIVVDTAQGSLQRLVSSQGSDCTVQTLCAGGPGSSEGTLVTESIDSGQGYVCEGQDWQYDAHQITSSCALNRDRWSNGTIRVPNSWNDVTIPFNQIEFKKQSLIGKGRFGEVHKAYWYGDVAVKLLNMDHVDEEKQLEAFKADVASFKNTRHDNIVLFMGYCLDQHKLGIVMCYCKGRSLHKILHEMTEKLQFSQIVHLATQICHGVSYLHTKRILHKDLRTKNIFIENRNRAVITDFGLFSMKRLGQPSRSYAFIVPEHWLSYLAPELIKALSPSLTMIPFSESTDVFSFGTIWFELMTREFPFACMPPEAIIWQVGHGIKGALRNVNTSRDVKEILLKCWSYNASERPNFMTLFDLLERLPKKRVMRSPSFPVSRSYESVF
ncbi:hypothetical protein AB6A40_006107 [Gnathostoma spinigerum]|uniref:Uncharacterized protein n=1 Tax=Gnathostoma spinigerum TaxID=75299 RepID=A0ABD6EHL1_9BILA